jgi:hypothetical protein
MLRQAFGNPAIERVFATTMAVNTGSRRVLEKLRMTHTATWVHKWEDPIRGWDRGEVRYELARAEWSTADLPCCNLAGCRDAAVHLMVARCDGLDGRAVANGSLVRLRVRTRTRSPTPSPPCAPSVVVHANLSVARQRLSERDRLGRRYVDAAVDGGHGPGQDGW